jgi:hypothetical protein
MWPSHAVGSNDLHPKQHNGVTQKGQTNFHVLLSLHKKAHSVSPNTCFQRPSMRSLVLTRYVYHKNTC